MDDFIFNKKIWKKVRLWSGGGGGWGESVKYDANGFVVTIIIVIIVPILI